MTIYLEPITQLDQLVSAGRCSRCRSLVLAEDAEHHKEWHETLDRTIRIVRNTRAR